VGKALPAHNEAVHTTALNALNQTSQNVPCLTPASVLHEERQTISAPSSVTAFRVPIFHTGLPDPPESYLQ
jgi:hypothetical protein